jgi:hypothetical protein
MGPRGLSGIAGKNLAMLTQTCIPEVGFQRRPPHPPADSNDPRKGSVDWAFAWACEGQSMARQG